MPTFALSLQLALLGVRVSIWYQIEGIEKV